MAKSKGPQETSQTKLSPQKKSVAASAEPAIPRSLNVVYTKLINDQTGEREKNVVQEQVTGGLSKSASLPTKPEPEQDLEVDGPSISKPE